MPSLTELASDPPTGAIELDDQGAVAWVRLNHPAKFNAMSRAMWVRLREVFEQFNALPRLRCVVVHGAQGHFCAGGDIAEYPSFRFDPQQLAHFHEVEVWGALAAILACEVPVLALIDGNCMGAGIEIASCCDVRLASDDARFGAPIARLGFPMAPREAAQVARVVGDTTARAMLLAAEVFDAAHMHAQGFLTRVLPPSELQVHGRDLAARIAQLAPAAARMNKQTLAGATMVQPYAYADSAEHREGISAFLDKRKPVF